MQNKETKKTVLVHKQKSFVPYALIVIALVTILVTVGWIFYSSYKSVQTASAQIGGQQFSLEVANTDSAREKGLSERDGLAKNTGMLFVFDTPGDWRMWMVQMRFPIDIAWLDENKKIVHIKYNATPAEYPEVYKADVPTKYVIEVPSGTFTSLNVQEGDSISFSL